MCKIEMGTPSISQDQLDQLEYLCNKYIREQRPMYPTYYDSADDPAIAQVCSMAYSSVNLLTRISVETVVNTS